MAEYDGGPAFPCPIISTPHGDVVWSWDNGGEGMSMRDWFAGQALAANIAYSLANGYSLTDAAEQSYLAADAMLKARNVIAQRDQAVAELVAKLKWAMSQPWARSNNEDTEVANLIAKYDTDAALGESDAKN